MKYESVQEIFTGIAERFPDRTAIDCADRSLSYRELRQRANRLANYFISRGAGKGSIVCIISEDSVETIIAILACLKSGCVFMPFDASTPEGRISAMLEEVTPQWYVIQSRFAQIVSRAHKQGSVAKVIFVDEEISAEFREGEFREDEFRDGLEHESSYGQFTDVSEPQIESNGDDVSSVFFTSGSAGKPKGITGRLKGIDHFIRWETQALGLEDDVRTSHLISPSFDAMLRDVFVPLCVGGTVCVPESRDTVLDAEKLIAWLDERRVNVVHCVPSLFRAIINHRLEAEWFPHLKYILMAGEALQPSDVAKWMDLFGERTQIVNLYGMTEVTMVKFAHFVKREDIERRSIPIGKPIDGTKALLINERGEPARPGSVGEIYIKTAYRSHGYYNRPDLTAEVFVKNPLSDNPQDIVYKTGDMGRMLEDGTYEYIGRRDHQVKIRGARVELGEVEAVLSRQEQVKEVAVVDREDTSGYKYLCAYVVLKEGADPTKIREQVDKLLPDYMAPGRYVIMNELPLTINGKVDRRALPPPGEGTDGLAESYIAPRTPIEEELAALWTGLLGVERVGVNDNFFHIGGHSLLGTQLLSRARDVFDVEIPLRVLFEAPTIAGLSLAIVQAQLDQQDLNDMAQIMDEIKSISDEELEALLDEEVEITTDAEAI